MQRLNVAPVRHWRFISIGVLALLLVGLAGMSVSTTNVSATDVQCGDFLTANTTLDSDLTCSGEGLIINANNITLDCAGRSITGSGVGSGISLSGQTGVNVKNCYVTGFNVGIRLESARNNTFRGNTAEANGGDGISLHSGFNNTLTGNATNRNNSVGISLREGNSNTLTGNVTNNNGFEGILLDESFTNTLTGNVANNNGSEGISLAGDGNILTGNAANSNGSAGFFLAIGQGNTFTGNTARLNGLDGFKVAASTINNTLEKNSSVSNGEYGYLDESHDTGTAGTANTYVNNRCSGNKAGKSLPAGLCGR